jgi:hypothetical protein
VKGKKEKDRIRDEILRVLPCFLFTSLFSLYFFAFFAFAVKNSSSCKRRA